MRPIGFHTVPRKLITLGQRVGSKVLCGAFLIAGALTTVFFSPFIIMSWILERPQNPKARAGRGSQECQITNIQEWTEEDEPER